MALACLDIYEEMALPDLTKRLGARIAQHLASIARRDGVLDVRCQGMLAAVEFETDGPQGPGLARRVGIEAEARGVLFRIIGDVLAIAPPYICSEADIDEIMAVMSASIRAVTGAGVGARAGAEPAA